MRPHQKSRPASFYRKFHLLVVLSFLLGATTLSSTTSSAQTHSVSSQSTQDTSKDKTLKEINESIRQSERENNRSTLIEAYIAKAKFMLSFNGYEEALVAANQALVLALQVGREYQVEQVYRIIAEVYNSRDLIFESLEYLYGGYQLSEQLKDTARLTHYLVSIIQAEQILGNLPRAVEYSLKAIDLFSATGDSLSIARTYHSLGLTHADLGNFKTSRIYLGSAAKLFATYNDSTGLGVAYTSLAKLSLQTNNLTESEENLAKAKAILIGTNKKFYLRSITLAGSLLSAKGSNMQAVNLFSKNIEDQALINDNLGLSVTFFEYGKALHRNREYQKSIEAFHHSIKKSKENGLINLSRQAYKELAYVVASTVKTSEAYAYLNQYVNVTDSLYNLQIISEANKLVNEVEIKKKEKEILLKEALIRQGSQQLKQQKRSQFLLYAILILSFGFIVFALREYLLKKRANAILSQQKRQIEDQKQIVDRRNRDITDSLNYARRIQRAILRTSSNLEEYFPESFILFIPKDIVSGDFYWVKKNNQRLMFAVSDCTGHGAPGAFMSIIGIYGLNRLAVEENLTNPGDILNSLNQLFTNSFEQDEGSEIFDGMDIGLCSYNPITQELNYAGANLPLHILRAVNLPQASSQIVYKNTSHALYQVKPNKQPLGYFFDEVDYTNHSIPLLKGDIIYLFTDGFADQFGGANGKKFMYQELRKLICSIADLDLPEQQRMLEKTYLDWKGNYIQVDDMSFMGIKLIDPA